MVILCICARTFDNSLYLCTHVRWFFVCVYAGMVILCMCARMYGNSLYVCTQVWWFFVSVYTRVWWFFVCVYACMVILCVCVRACTVILCSCIHACLVILCVCVHVRMVILVMHLNHWRNEHLFWHPQRLIETWQSIICSKRAWMILYVHTWCDDLISILLSLSLFMKLSWSSWVLTAERGLEKRFAFVCMRLWRSLVYLCIVRFSVSVALNSKDHDLFICLFVCLFVCVSACFHERLYCLCTFVSVFWLMCICLFSACACKREKVSLCAVIVFLSFYVCARG